MKKYTIPKIFFYNKTMNKKLLKIEEITFSLDENEDDIHLQDKTAKILWIKKEQILSLEKVKRALDSRNKKQILVVWSVLVDIWDNENFLSKAHHPKLLQNIKRHKIRLQEPFVYDIKKVDWSKVKKRPIVVGSGPSGLFSALLLAQAWLKPIILERGSEVNQRVQDVHNFWTKRVLNIHSNVQFGEWWAGTFSDGKLYTLVNDPRSKFIFSEFVNCGAPEEILYSARPHIGTDRLRWVVRNLRKKIISLWWDFFFDTMMSNISIENGKISGVYLQSTKEGSSQNYPENNFFATDDLILWLWHSARETYEMLYNAGLQMTQKPFAIWVRIEHPRELINTSQFWESCQHIKLPTANYKLVAHNKETRSVYTFCMCPGWEVVNASSEDGKLCINGMSHYAQKNINSNSALLVNINPSDFWSDHPLAWVAFQRYWEQKAFEAGGSDASAPAQLVGDFLAGKPSTDFWNVNTTFKPSLHFTSLEKCLPDFVVEALKKALPEFDKKIHWFADPNAILIAIEARTSAVVRFFRDDNWESNIKWIYPTGEWAWFAGGITSSSIDGMIIWEKILEKYS